MFSDDERVRSWIEHIIENSDRIADYIADMRFEDFVADTKVRDAVERCVGRITEAAMRLGPERMAAIAPDVPLNEVRGLGNVLRHDYDRIDPKLIWDTAQGDLPVLRAHCVRALGTE